MFDVILEIIAGLFFLFLGFFIGKKQRIDFLHSYHYINVVKEDIPAFTKRMGIALAILGLLIFTKPLLDTTLGKKMEGYILIPFVIIDILIMLGITIYYNGSIFGIRKKVGGK